MNTIQLQCSGTTLSKPLMCWSLLDWSCVVGAGCLVVFIGVVVSALLHKIKKPKVSSTTIVWATKYDLLAHLKGEITTETLGKRLSRVKTETHTEQVKMTRGI